jgi:hypothetical protein
VVTGSDGAEVVVEPVIAGGVLLSALCIGSISAPLGSPEDVPVEAMAPDDCGLGGLRTMRLPELPPPTAATACE